MVFSNNIADIDPEEVVTILEDVVVATSTDSTGGSTNFATDLDLVNSILDSSLLVLNEHIRTSTDTLELNEVNYNCVLLYIIYFVFCYIIASYLLYYFFM